MLFTDTYNAQHNGGSYVNGDWISTVLGEFAFTASVQPMNPREMEALPEGRRDKAALKLYTTTLLQTANEEHGTNADTVTIGGETYEVESVSSWQMGTMPHYKVIVILK